MPSLTHHQINPKKLRLTKWTAVEPRDKEKHFLVTKVIDPEQPKHLIEFVEVEAVLTRRSFTMRWCARRCRGCAPWILKARPSSFRSAKKF
jgi:tryptophan-rich hypothetical protein